MGLQLAVVKIPKRGLCPDGVSLPPGIPSKPSVSGLIGYGKATSHIEKIKVLTRNAGFGAEGMVSVRVEKCALNKNPHGQSAKIGLENQIIQPV